MAARGRRLGCLVGLLFLLAVLWVVALVLAAGPLAEVQRDATAARDELAEAADALRDGRVRAARQHVTRAEGHVEDARGPAYGLAGDVWHRVPVAGGAVEDMRHLLTALDETTTVAGIAVDVYPEVTDPRRVNRLMSGNTVDVDGVTAILAEVERAIPHLRRARSELDEVEADVPLVGGRIAAARDAAADRIDPLADAADRLEPLLDGLPVLLGAEGRMRYLVAFMNPAEQRYSGGAVLTSSSLTARDGRMTFGDVLDGEELRALGGEDFGNTWPAVEGNPFHGPGMVRLPKATFHPDWTVSGEELLRAYRSKGLGRYDAVIAVDPVALARLLQVSGPVEVPGLAAVTHQNLTRLLVGSYDEFSSQADRKALNAAVFLVFKERFFAVGDLSGKAQALGSSATDRHLVVHARDPGLQDALEEMGLAGRLSGTEQDYLGVFSRNLTASKADFWQQRSVHSRIDLDAGGDARVRLRVDTTNNAPPYQQQPFQAQPIDPGRGYWTKILVSQLLVVLPQGSEADRVTLDGEEPRGVVPAGRKRAALTRGLLEDGRRYVEIPMRLERGQTSRVQMRYAKRGAAVVDGDRMTYRLDYDPQGMVTPQRLSVDLYAPDGWEVSRLPAGWTDLPDGAAYTGPGGASRQRWEIELRRTS